MKTKELIALLEDLVCVHGDLPVRAGLRELNTPVTGVWIEKDPKTKADRVVLASDDGRRNNYG